MFVACEIYNLVELVNGICEPLLKRCMMPDASRGDCRLYYNASWNWSSSFKGVHFRKNSIPKYEEEFRLFIDDPWLLGQVMGRCSGQSVSWCHCWWMAWVWKPSEALFWVFRHFRGPWNNNNYNMSCGCLQERSAKKMWWVNNLWLEHFFLF